jgi:hypothetical protein
MTLVMEGTPTMGDLYQYAETQGCKDYEFIAHWHFSTGLKIWQAFRDIAFPCAVFWLSEDEKLYYVGKIVEVVE